MTNASDQHPSRARFAHLALSEDGGAGALPVLDGTMGPSAVDVRGLLAGQDLLTFDPGFRSTASCSSAITYIDGEKGILLYRGYPIEQLAAKYGFLDVAYLLLRGELPTADESLAFESDVRIHNLLHEQVLSFYRGFRRDAHPMAVMVGVVGALSAFYQDLQDYENPTHQWKAAIRLIAKMPMIAASCYSYNMGLPFRYPNNRLSYAGNFLQMMFGKPNDIYEVDPVLERALDVILTLHADHEQRAHGGKLGCQSVCLRGIRYCHAMGAGTRRGQRGGAEHAREHRYAREHPQRDLPRQGQERSIPPDGIRSPGLPEL